MHIILVKNVKNCYAQVTRSVVTPGVFVSMLMLGSVPYAAYHYQGQQGQSNTDSSHASTYSQFRQQSRASLKAKTLALRVEQLHSERLKLDKLSQHWQKQTPSEDKSLGWEEIIAEHDLSEELGIKDTSSRQLTHKNAVGKVSEEIQKEKFIVSQDLLLKYRSGDKILPTGWPLRYGRISSKYGWRGRRMHKGLDIAAPARSEIIAVEAGVVTQSTVMRGYGKIVEIKHSDTYSTRYAHNTKNLVEVGERVEKGQVVALVGATGRATGNHIHFEVRESGKAIDPLKYLSALEHMSLASNIKISEHVVLSKK